MPYWLPVSSDELWEDYEYDLMYDEGTDDMYDVSVEDVDRVNIIGLLMAEEREVRDDLAGKTKPELIKLDNVTYGARGKCGRPPMPKPQGHPNNHGLLMRAWRFDHGMYVVDRQQKKRHDDERDYQHQLLLRNEDDASSVGEYIEAANQYSLIFDIDREMEANEQEIARMDAEQDDDSDDWFLYKDAVTSDESDGSFATS